MGENFWIIWRLWWSGSRWPYIISWEKIFEKIFEKIWIHEARSWNYCNQTKYLTKKRSFTLSCQQNFLSFPSQKEIENSAISFKKNKIFVLGAKWKNHFSIVTSKKCMFSKNLSLKKRYDDSLFQKNENCLKWHFFFNENQKIIQNWDQSSSSSSSSFHHSHFLSAILFHFTPSFSSSSHLLQSIVIVGIFDFDSNKRFQ